MKKPLPILTRLLVESTRSPRISTRRSSTAGSSFYNKLKFVAPTFNPAPPPIVDTFLNTENENILLTENNNNITI